jgi:hypothetical protein
MRLENVYLRWSPRQNEGFPRLRQWAPAFSQKKYFLSPRQETKLFVQDAQGEKTPYQERLENSIANWWNEDEFRKQI